jgi:hypothetical protein
MEALANTRADTMINARKRHFEDLLLKKNWYMNKEITEDQQREANNKKRYDNFSTIQQRRFENTNVNK